MKNQLIRNFNCFFLFSNLDCQWIIDSNDASYKVILYLKNYNVACSGDNINIYDGKRTLPRGNLLLRGNTLPTGNTLLRGNTLSIGNTLLRGYTLPTGNTLL